MARLTKAQIEADINARIVMNDTGAIDDVVLRDVLQNIIDSGIVGVPGSNARPALKWIPTTGWTPVSDTTVQYMAITREDDWPTLQAALIAHFTLGGNENYIPNPPSWVSLRLSSYQTVGGPNTGGVDALLTDLWPVGTLAPFVWLVTPTAHGWHDRSRVTVSTRVNNAGDGAMVETEAHFGRLPYDVTINDVQFDIGRYRTSLPRPTDAQATPGEAALRFIYKYAPAPAVSPVVNQIIP